MGFGGVGGGVVLLDGVVGELPAPAVSVVPAIKQKAHAVKVVHRAQSKPVPRLCEFNGNQKSRRMHATYDHLYSKA